MSVVTFRLLSVLAVLATLSAYGARTSAAPDLRRSQVQNVAWQSRAGGAAPQAKTARGRQARPLTAEQQERFKAGQEIYQGICVACHQPDGRGKEKLAPSLIGSRFALARPEIPIRILLSGKQGSVGMMPPVGGTLNDDQIANVLTYVRREWGQTGSPVDAATVKQVRAQTSDRSRPWTDDELKELMAGSK